MGRDRRSVGWRIVQVAAVVVFAVNAVALVVVLVFAARERGLWQLLSTAAVGLVSLVFWRWIALGAGARAERPEPDPADPDAPHRMGPWGYVGAVLMVLLVAGFAALFIWSEVETNRQDAAVAQVRKDAVVVAERDRVSVEQVQGAVARRTTAAWNGEEDDPLTALFPVPHATVQDASVEDGEALVLLRPDRGGPPCVILRIAADGDVDTLTTDRCA